MSSDIAVNDKKSTIISIFSGILVAIASTLIMILLFAIVIRFFNINDNWIFPVNQVIKTISIFLGLLIVFKKSNGNGLIKGIILGGFYYFVSILIFSILQKKFTLGVSNIYDFLLTILIGGIVGIIIVNFKKR